MLYNINFLNLIKVPHSFVNFTKISFSKSSVYNCKIRSPYEVLDLKNTCTTKDVKKAYIKLCKELHPDRKPNDSSQHKKFVELNNAYSILVDEKRRKQYDDSPTQTSPNNVYRNYQYTKPMKQYSSSKPFENKTEDDESWYESQAYKEQEEYYRQQMKNSHIKFQAKQNNILLGCFLLVVGGFIMYYAAYRYATYYTLKKVDERSRKISESFKAREEIALTTGRDEQLAILKEKWNKPE